MRRPKISLKKYFYFTLFCALLLVFGFNLKEREIWKSKSVQSQAVQQLVQHGDLIADRHHTESAARLPRLQQEVVVAAAPPQAPPMVAASYASQTHSLDTGADWDTVNWDGNTGSGSNSNQVGNIESTSATLRPWFFKNGEYYPKPFKRGTNMLAHKKSNAAIKFHAHSAKMFPYQNPHSDRIVNQLMYVPPNYNQIRASGKLKTILLFNGLGPWNVKQGRDVFLRSKCPVDTCELTANRDRAGNADMILYKDHYVPTGMRRPLNSQQVTMLYYLECPYHTQNVKIPDAINWTATYRYNFIYMRLIYTDPKH